MRVSRPCYDKPWRCPTWAGAGWGWSSDKDFESCDSGPAYSITERKFWKYRPWKCKVCGIIVLPVIIRFIDPYHWFISVKSYLYLLQREYRWQQMDYRDFKLALNDEGHLFLYCNTKPCSEHYISIKRNVTVQTIIDTVDIHIRWHREQKPSV